MFLVSLLRKDSTIIFLCKYFSNVLPTLCHCSSPHIILFTSIVLLSSKMMKTTFWLCFSLLSMTYSAKSQHYVNQFAVEIKGGEHVAREVARSLGYKYITSVCIFIYCHSRLYFINIRYNWRLVARLLIQQLDDNW